MQRQEESCKREAGSKKTLKDTALLALKMEEATISSDMQA